MSLLIYTLSTGPENGWLTPQTIATGVIGVAAIVGLVVVELGLEQPMLQLRLFANRLFRIVNISSSMVYAGFFGWIFVLPLYMQTLRGFWATQSGLVQAPQALAVFVVSNLLGKRVLPVRRAPRRLMVVGSAATAVVTGCVRVRRSRHPAVGDRRRLGGPRCSDRDGLRVDPDRRVRHRLESPTPAVRPRCSTPSAKSRSPPALRSPPRCIAAKVSAVGGDAAPAIDRLPAYQWGFLAMGLVMLPAAVTSWFVQDEDVAATRGLA